MTPNTQISTALVRTTKTKVSLLWLVSVLSFKRVSCSSYTHGTHYSLFFYIMHLNKTMYRFHFNYVSHPSSLTFIYVCGASPTKQSFLSHRIIFKAHKFFAKVSSAFCLPRKSSTKESWLCLMHKKLCQWFSTSIN